jgi:hypothetical protein
VKFDHKEFDEYTVPTRKVCLHINLSSHNPRTSSDFEVVQRASLATAEKAKRVNAEEFLLLDPSGKARAGLGLDQNGEVGLVLTSRDGNRSLYLTPDERPVIKFTDRDGQIIWSAP